MDLAILENAAWRAAAQPLPSAVARSVESLRSAYLDERGHGPGAGAPRRGAGLLARQCFFGVADAGKLPHVLGELASAGALPTAETWRVLDLGSGPGLTSLAVCEWLRQRGRPPRLELTLVDHDAESLVRAQAVFSAWRALLTERGLPVPGVSLRTLPLALGAARLPPGPFELITCVNVLNELRGDEGVAPRLRVVKDALALLAPGGSLCLLEPALREPSRALHAMRDALLEEGTTTVFAPCLRRSAPCPMLASERDWCHEERPAELPERTRLIARISGVRRESLKWSYLTLRRDGRSLRDAHPAATERVVSTRLVSKGREEAFVCGEHGRLRVLRNRRDRSEANAGFDEVERGALLCCEPPLDPARPRVGAETRVVRWDPGAQA